MATWLATSRSVEDVSVFLVGDDEIAAALPQVGHLKESIQATVERHSVASSSGGRHLRIDPASRVRGRLAVYATENAEQAIRALDARLGARAGALVRARVLVCGPRGKRCLAWAWVARTERREHATLVRVAA